MQTAVGVVEVDGGSKAALHQPRPVLGEDGVGRESDGEATDSPAEPRVEAGERRPDGGGEEGGNAGQNDTDTEVLDCPGHQLAVIISCLELLDKLLLVHDVRQVAGGLHPGPLLLLILLLLFSSSFILFSLCICSSFFIGF